MALSMARRYLANFCTRSAFFSMERATSYRVVSLIETNSGRNFHECDIRRPLPNITTQRSFASSSVSAELVLSDSCVSRIKELNAGADDSRTMLRVSVDGGGCSGFQYAFTFEEEVNENDDHVIERDGAKVVVDSISFSFLKGSTVDYTEELIRASFQITNNPNAENSCGCGTSFAVK